MQYFLDYFLLYLKLHKLKLMAMTILIAALGVFTFIGANAASSAPTSFTANSEKLLDGYIANWHYAKLTSSLGGYVYCTDFHKGIPYNVKMTLSGEAPAGLAYIISNGFPRVNITGNSDIDYYITQAAVWWYLDETTGSNNLPDAFKYTGSDPHNIRHYVKELVEGAKKQTSYATPAISLINNDSTLNLTSDGKYYESGTMSVKTLYTTGNYTVSLSNAPEGTVVVNTTNGATQNSFSPSESFKVRIPESSVDVGSLNITVKVTATGSINKAYMYKSNDSTKQDVMGSVLYPETSTVTDQTNLTLETSKVTITKIDDETEKPLAGATFEVKDSTGKVVEEFITTTKPHKLNDLADGTYTVEEKEAPAGYEKTDEIYKFTVNEDNRNATITIENAPIEKLVNILKVDAATGNPLSGATLVVKDSTGKVVEEFVTTEEAHTITNLTDGEYTVEEKEAPAGYNKSDEVYKFTISDETPTALVIFENNEIVEVPFTGSNKSLISTIFGSMLLISGVGFVYYNGKKQKVK